MRGPSAPPAALQTLTPAALAVLPDERLARLAAAGSRPAFAAIYERYHQPLYRYCLSILGDAEDARDALQSAMVKTLQAMVDRGPPVALKPWMYRVAHNESVSTLRRRRTHEEMGEVASERAPEHDGRERLAQLLEDLRELPETQRTVLVMRELAGLGCSEIASALGASPAAVRQTLHEARRALCEYAVGRDTDCYQIQRKLSDGDHRAVRSRKLRAHLRACTGCREFRDAMTVRPRELGVLIPPLPAGAAAAVLHGVLGGTSSAGADGGSLAAIGRQTERLLRFAAAAKPTAAATVALTVGAGAVELGNRVGSSEAAARKPGVAAPGSDRHRRGPPKGRLLSTLIGHHLSEGPPRASSRLPSSPTGLVTPEESDDAPLSEPAAGSTPSSDAGPGGGAARPSAEPTDGLSELALQTEQAVGDRHDAAADRLREPAAVRTEELPAPPSGPEVPDPGAPSPPQPELPG